VSEGFWVHFFLRSPRGFHAETFEYLKFADGYKKDSSVKDRASDWATQKAAHCEMFRWGYDFKKPPAEWIAARLKAAHASVRYWRDRQAGK